MSTRELWIIAGMALVTFLCRYPLMALATRITLAPTLRRVLHYVGPAVLAAVIVPEMLATSPADPGPALLHPRLIAGLVAGWVAWKTHNVWLTIVTALGVLLLVRALVNALPASGF